MLQNTRVGNTRGCPQMKTPEREREREYSLFFFFLVLILILILTCGYGYASDSASGYGEESFSLKPYFYLSLLLLLLLLLCSSILCSSSSFNILICLSPAISAKTINCLRCCRKQSVVSLIDAPPLCCWYVLYFFNKLIKCRSAHTLDAPAEIRKSPQKLEIPSCVDWTEFPALDVSSSHSMLFMNQESCIRCSSPSSDIFSMACDTSSVIPDSRGNAWCMYIYAWD